MPSGQGNAAGIMLGVALLLWPALLNGYPLLFSDTGAFLSQGLDWFMVWDKPWVYGPMLGLASLRLTLWLPAIAQTLLLSWLLWRVLGSFALARPVPHLVLCVALAFGTAAPWFASLLMADIFAPITVLCLFLLGFGPQRGKAALALIGAFAIAAHLAHLLIAAAVIGVILLLRPRAVLRAAAPLVLALLALLATNAIGHGRFSISPYGSVFLLARLTADGPARDFLARACPDAGYSLCAWAGRLPADADQFIWHPQGPVWSHPGGPPALAPEAGAIIRATLLADPLGVARVMAINTAAQLVHLQLDEVLGNYWLEETVGERLRRLFPASEYSRFQASRQHADTLRAMAAPLQAAQAALLGLAALACLAILARTRRQHPRLAALTALVLAGVLANAFATGALSGPHDRYQARIAWLLVLPLLLYAMRRVTSAGSDRDHPKRNVGGCGSRSQTTVRPE